MNFGSKRARIHWTDKTTGRNGIYEDPIGYGSMGGDENDFSIYWWAEGNGACKSNRETFFVGGEGDLSEEHQCDDDRFTINLLEVINDDGSVLQTFDAAEFVGW